MNTRKFTGDMSSQVEADRDELVALRAKCERLEGERDEWKASVEAVALASKEVEDDLLAVIEQCREVIEYAGCHDHTEDIPKFNRPCQLCVKVDDALAAIKKVKESK